MPKPTAAVLLVLLSLSACGGKTIEGARNEGAASEAQPAAPSEPVEPGPPSAPPAPPTPTPTPTPAPVTPCGPSFRYDVLQTLKDRGCTNSSCHGGTSPLNQPRIDGRDFYATWSAPRAFTLSTGQPYVASADSTPTASAMHCHLRGECGLPMSNFITAGAVSPTELAVIEEWLACGAPFD